MCVSASVSVNDLILALRFNPRIVVSIVRVNVGGLVVVIYFARAILVEESNFPGASGTARHPKDQWVVHWVVAGLEIPAHI